MNTATLRRAGWLLCCALPFTALADTASRWDTGVALEVDEEGGVAVLADAAFAASARSSVSVAFSRADSASNLSRLTTTGVEAGLYHDFGTLGVDLRAGHWADSDVVAANELHAALDWHGTAWSAALLGSWRQGDFEPFVAVGTVELRDGTLLPVAGIADCDLDGTGVGARLQVAGKRWSGYVTAMSYDYEDASCRFSSPGLERLRRSSRAVFRQFAATITGQLAIGAQTRIGAEHAFLDSSAAAGVEYDAGRLRYRLDYSHSREEFEQLESDTLAATLSLAATRTVELAFTAGVSDGERLDTLGFAGIGLRARF